MIYYRSTNMALLHLLLLSSVYFIQIWQSQAKVVKEFASEEELKQDLSNVEVAMVDFFASWCPHCVNFAPIFEKAAERISTNGNLKEKVHMIKIQCDMGYKGESNPICTAHGIQGYPTIYVFKRGKKFDQYKGERTPEAIVKYIEEIANNGKAKFIGTQIKDTQVCMAKDFMKYVLQKS
ncbi:putative protein disulfide-isomerase C1F5.02 [Xenia sp. Carnegie-2017]|uniref:putative protein disulfide-isomerase C1F5.02 n=1 Tax=Xenia sp. Carnegie-2017 TaxID=2897299 RepID=UPI001F03984E|nr:putative protein disulfide-isomerase C1F5.02 [Xenia sp. Carnegie-2017]